MKQVIELLENELKECNESISYIKQYTTWFYDEPTRLRSQCRIEREEIYLTALQKAINILKG